MQTQSELTYGQKAVGIDFNPSGNADVNEVKELYAQLIDKLNAFRTEGRTEKSRLASIAITEAQGAQMWAVKTITFKE